METLDAAQSRLVAILTTGIAGTEFTLAKLIIVVLLAALLVWLTGRLTRWATEHVLVRRGIDVGVAQALATIGRYAIVTLGLILILQGVGIDLSALTVLVGALGVGLGFGLQNVTNNFVSGLIILFERPIKAGDRVEVGDTTGTVRRIGARATTIVTNDNVAIIVPNSDFISERVTNWSYTGRRVRVAVPVGVSYDADPHRVRDILLGVCRDHPGILADPAPDVVFTEFGDSSLGFELRVWTETFIRTPSVLRSEVNFAIWDALKAGGVEIPFPQRDLHIRDGALAVRIQGA